MGYWESLKAHPLIAGFSGWVLFLAMYPLVGVFTALDLSVEWAFLLASPLGFFALLCWVLALGVGVKNLGNGPRYLLAIAVSLPPFGVLVLGLWVAANGGV